MTNNIVLEQLENTLKLRQGQYDKYKAQYEDEPTKSLYGIMKYVQGEINMLQATIRAINYFG